MQRNTVSMVNTLSITYANGKHKYRLWLQMLNNDKYNVFNVYSEHNHHIIISLVETFILMLHNGCECYVLDYYHI